MDPPDSLVQAEQPTVRISLICLQYIGADFPFNDRMDNADIDRKPFAKIIGRCRWEKT